ncbi:MAG: hypothetical protein PHG85_07170 [Candidatus Altiarchaeota archaeon]|nr:hypothetical protein [Candidatus Altiarchaeota archaeon]
MEAPEILVTCCGITLVIAAIAFFAVILFVIGTIGRKRYAAKMNALAAALGCAYANGVISGDFHGRRMTLDYPVKTHHHTDSHGHHHTDRTTYTRIQVPHKGVINGQIEVYKQGFLSSLGKVLGMQDIAIGSPDFDKEFIVKGPGEPVVRKVLDLDVQHKMMQLKVPITVNPDRVQYEVAGEVTDKQRILDIAGLMVRIAENAERQ